MSDLSEVPLDVGLCGGEELEAAVEVGEGPDAEAVGGVELGLEELAARVPHVSQLQQVSGGEQGLYIVLGNINLYSFFVNLQTLLCFSVHLACVHVVHEDVEGLGVDPLEDDPGAVPLGEAGEHGAEVGGARGEEHLVGGDLGVVRHQGHVAQQPRQPHGVHPLERLGGVRHVLVRRPLVLAELVSELL